MLLSLTFKKDTFIFLALNIILFKRSFIVIYYISRPIPVWNIQKTRLLASFLIQIACSSHLSLTKLFLILIPKCSYCFSISQKTVSSVAVNPSGEWLAFGCATIGQLLVWEWQSESYILKQQGHYYDMNCLAYSPDGNYIATGGDDAKVKF